MSISQYSEYLQGAASYADVSLKHHTLNLGSGALGSAYGSCCPARPGLARPSRGVPDPTQPGPARPSLARPGPALELEIQSQPLIAKQKTNVGVGI